MSVLAKARPVDRPLTVRRMVAVARPGLLTAGAAAVRHQLTAACGPTLVGPVVVSCWPPATAHDHVDCLLDNPGQRAVTHALLAAHPHFFLIVGSCHQLWPQLTPELS